MIRAPLLVGLVLVGSAISLSWFVVSTSKDKFDDENTRLVQADFQDASGIRWKTRVQINGIDVGKIDEIVHVRTDDGRLVARVKLRVLNEYKIYGNAHLKKAAESLLGDFRIDLDPGAPQSKCDPYGQCGDGFKCEQNVCIRECSSSSECTANQVCEHRMCVYQPIEAAGMVTSVQSVSDMDAIQGQLKEVAQNVNAITGSMSRVFAGPDGEGSLKSILQNVEASMASIQKATEAMSSTMVRNDKNVNDIINNLNQFTEALATNAKSGGNLAKATENVASLTARLDEVAKNINQLVSAESQDNASVRQTLEKLNESMAYLASITRKIDEGRGTIGKVINEPGIAQKVEETLDEANSLIKGVSQLQTSIELRTQYEIPFAGSSDELQSGVKNTLALRIAPKPDKYYLIEAVADPRGSSTRRIKTTTEGGTTNKVEESVIEFNDLKFSLMFAKRYFFLTMRFGIIENTGGLGLNFHMLDDDLEFRLDAFDFNRRNPDNNRSIFPRLRSTSMYQFLDHLWVQAGIDDPFNSKLRTWFLGGMLTFTDEDLRSLLIVAPTP